MVILSVVLVLILVQSGNREPVMVDEEAVIPDYEYLCFRSGMDFWNRPGSQDLPEIVMVRWVSEQDALGCWGWRQKELRVEVVQPCLLPALLKGLLGVAGDPEGWAEAVR